MPRKRLEAISLPLGVEPEYVSVNQACLIMGIGRSKLYELIAESKVESDKLDGKRRVRLRSCRAAA